MDSVQLLQWTASYISYWADCVNRKFGDDAGGGLRDLIISVARENLFIEPKIVGDLMNQRNLDLPD